MMMMMMMMMMMVVVVVLVAAMMMVIMTTMTMMMTKNPNPYRKNNHSSDRLMITGTVFHVGGVLNGQNLQPPRIVLHVEHMPQNAIAPARFAFLLAEKKNVIKNSSPLSLGN
jgi:hypothetical protein